ncbi:RNA splicing factor Pad-1 [Magnaporthiopsis poae ATCC 64411]|uniref:RNA splicing factor Pad-1 n=1 Tax=Magnaporthiopsis poae (strain ATCC 64411 / 73-15) TaxID=644358 RepID=A0A0C4E7F4_MAGP6|nr:RNA splicing factor Pad-1 [Magnaporthiopsis poae ATCC 64411]
MSTLDVEALLENAAANADSPRSATVVADNDTNGDNNHRSRRGGDHGNDRRGRRAGSRGRDGSPAQLTEDERDRRTVFVQQLAARLRTKELHEFFEQAGPVAAAQIVKDRVSNRSKGVGYVEFKSEDSLAAALQLTGRKLAGIPVIVQPTEAEKNRQVRTTENSNSNGTQQNSVLFHRLYVGNIHFSITEPDLRTVFGPFGELRFVQLQKDDNGRSRGYGFVEYNDPANAREALEKMNGFDLAGRPIRVGLGNDKFTPESTANIMQRYPGSNGGNQGPGYSGRNGQANGPQSSNFDRAGGRDSDKGGGASALDDTDVAGVNFNSYSRDALMRKLARTDEASTAPPERQQILKPKTETKPLPVNVNMASRCVLLKNMFDPAQETGEDWIKELEDEVRTEAEKKYGHVVHISLDPNSNGDIYLKFDKVQGGENAIKGLNGRYFGGNIITASPVVDAVYSSLFARTKAI